MDFLFKALLYSIRTLLRRPGFTAVVVVTLALGIGANTAIFSVVNAVLLQPLTYREPERLVSLWENVPVYGQWRVTPANFFDWKKQNTVFEGLAAFGASTLTLTGQGEPEQLQGTRASVGYFQVVGVEPVLGRPFLKEEYEPGKGQVVILGHGLWQRRFGGSPDIIGRTISLNDAPYTVVGVMPDGIFPAWPTTAGAISFNPDTQQFWTPMSFSAEWAANRRAHVLGVIGRLKPGITLEQAQSEMNIIGARLEQAYAENKDEGILVNPFMQEVVGDVKPALLVLLGAVALVLLIACANIAGLILAQHAARSKEIAIRAALGAGRWQLMRQFFMEGFLLSLAGAAAGVAVAVFGVQTLTRFIPQEIPRLDQVQMDLPVLGFTSLLALLTCLAFGFLPAWQASKPDLQETMEQGQRSSGSHSMRHGLRRLLVVLQVTMAVMLVIGSGLLIKTFWRLRQVDPGFKPEKVLSLSLSLPQSRYQETYQINSFFNQLLERLKNIPGVSSVAVAYDHPLEANWIDSFAIEGRPQSAASERRSANFHPVSWDYFRTVGTRILRGREFTARDDQDHSGVVIVNEAFVRTFFPDQEPLGQRLRPSPPARIWEQKKLTSFEIIGIARDIKSSGLNAEAEPAYYIPAPQAPLQDMTVLLRSQTEPESLVPAIRKTVLEIDPNQPIANIKTMEKIVADSIAQPRLNMILMGMFGGLALLLAAVGIYGLLSYSVIQRTQEIGIRMALGARVPDVLKLVLGNGMTLVLIGEVLGLAGALALTRLMSGLLFEVTPTDPWIFAVVFVFLGLVALVACYLPARRAAKVDPLVALRTE